MASDYGKIKIAELEEHWLRESIWLGPGGTRWDQVGYSEMA